MNAVSLAHAALPAPAVAVGVARVAVASHGCGASAAPAQNVWRDVVDPHLLPHLLEPACGRARARHARRSCCSRSRSRCSRSPAPHGSKSRNRCGRAARRWSSRSTCRAATLAADLPPSRLLQARAKIATLLRERAGGQVGLRRVRRRCVHRRAAHRRCRERRAVPRFACARRDAGRRPSPGSRHRTRRRTAAARPASIAATSCCSPTTATPRATMPRRASGAQGMRVSVLGLGSEHGHRVPHVRRRHLARRARSAFAARARDARAAALTPTCRRGRCRPARARRADRRRRGRDVDAGPRGQRSWEDAGYWLLPPLMLLALFAFRRGAGVAAMLVVLVPAVGFAQAQDAPKGTLWRRAGPGGRAAHGGRRDSRIARTISTRAANAYERPARRRRAVQPRQCAGEAGPITTQRSLPTTTRCAQQPACPTRSPTGARSKPRRNASRRPGRRKRNDPRAQGKQDGKQSSNSNPASRSRNSSSSNGKRQQNGQPQRRKRSRSRQQPQASQQPGESQHASPGQTALAATAAGAARRRCRATRTHAARARPGQATAEPQKAQAQARAETPQRTRTPPRERSLAAPRARRSGRPAAREVPPRIRTPPTGGRRMTRNDGPSQSLVLFALLLRRERARAGARVAGSRPHRDRRNRRRSTSPPIRARRRRPITRRCERDFILSGHQRSAARARINGRTTVQRAVLGGAAAAPRRRDHDPRRCASAGNARRRSRSTVAPTSRVPAQAGDDAFIECGLDDARSLRAAGGGLKRAAVLRRAAGLRPARPDPNRKARRCARSARTCSTRRTWPGAATTWSSAAYLLIGERSGTRACCPARVPRTGRRWLLRRSARRWPASARRRCARSRRSQVRAIPANAPQPWLPLTDLRLRYVALPQAARAGEAATVTIEAIADGAVAAQMPELQARLPSGAAQVFPAAVAGRRNLHRRPSAHARLSRKFSIVPTRAGALRIEPPRLEWWDVRAGVARTATLPPIELQVRPAPARMRMARRMRARPPTSPTQRKPATVASRSPASRGACCRGPRGRSVRAAVVVHAVVVPRPSSAARAQDSAPAHARIPAPRPQARTGRRRPRRHRRNTLRVRRSPRRRPRCIARAHRRRRPARGARRIATRALGRRRSARRARGLARAPSPAACAWRTPARAANVPDPLPPLYPPA